MPRTGSTSPDRRVLSRRATSTFRIHHAVGCAQICQGFDNTLKSATRIRCTIAIKRCGEDLDWVIVRETPRDEYAAGRASPQECVEFATTCRHDRSGVRNHALCL